MKTVPLEEKLKNYQAPIKVRSVVLGFHDHEKKIPLIEL